MKLELVKNTLVVVEDAGLKTPISLLYGVNDSGYPEPGMLTMAVDIKGRQYFCPLSSYQSLVPLEEFHEEKVNPAPIGWEVPTKEILRQTTYFVELDKHYGTGG